MIGDPDFYPSRIQKGTGSWIPDPGPQHWLSVNITVGLSYFQMAEDKLVVIDFFATWWVVIDHIKKLASSGDMI